MDTSVSMKTTSQSGTKNTTTLSNVNPNASNELLKQYAQRMASLSTDTYAGATKIEKTSLDDADTKAERTIQMFKLDADWENITDTVTGPINFNSLPDMSNDAGQGYIITYEGDSQTPCQYLFDNKTYDTFQALFLGYPIYYAASQNIKGRAIDMVRDIGTELSAGKSANITIHVDEDDTYQAADFVVTIQGGNS